MGFGKYLQIPTRHWPGCHGNQQCWDTATRPSEEGSPWSSGDLWVWNQPLLLLCYSANACQGAENVCELKAFLPLLSCCFRKSIYPVLGSSSLLSAAKQEQGRERQGHQHRTHLAMFYRFPLPASSNYSKKKTCSPQTVLMGYQLSKYVCWKAPFTKGYLVKEVIFSVWELGNTFWLLECYYFSVLI